MAKKKARAPKVETAASKPEVRHARIELSPEEYERLEWAADRIALNITAFVRMATLRAILSEEKDAGIQR